jgi:hypothetical protein
VTGEGETGDERAARHNTVAAAHELPRLVPMAASREAPLRRSMPVSSSPGSEGYYARARPRGRSLSGVAMSADLQFMNNLRAVRPRHQTIGGQVRLPVVVV